MKTKVARIKTEQFEGFIVILDKTLSEEDANYVQDAVKMIKGVLDTSPLLADPTSHCAYERGKRETELKLMRALQDV